MRENRDDLLKKRLQKNLDKVREKAGQKGWSVVYPWKIGEKAKDPEGWFNQVAVVGQGTLAMGMKVRVTDLAAETFRLCPAVASSQDGGHCYATSREWRATIENHTGRWDVEAIDLTVQDLEDIVEKGPTYDKGTKE